MSNLENAQREAMAQYDSIVKLVRALDEPTYAEDFVACMTCEAKEVFLSSIGAGHETGDEAIVELFKDGHVSKDYDFDEDTARERIQEDALEVSVRSGWYAPGHTPPEPEEFLILLCTGGPAVRIIGELDEHNEPTRARLQCQDWFTPWAIVTDERIDHDVLLTYCRQFYFGE